jgi:hypothetical protein
MQQLFFNDRLGMGAWFHEWEEFDHPELGKVEIGGWSKWWGRTTIPFMLQELLHRNAMFAIFHADEMPLLRIQEPTVERIAGSTYRVTVEVRNERAIPSRLEIAELNNTGNPDHFRIRGSNVTVQAGGLTSGELQNEIRMVERNPEDLVISGGVQGHTGVSVTWIVTGSGSATIGCSSDKGGTHRTTVQLR